MYTIVFHTDDLELIDTQKAYHPKVQNVKCAYYIVEGEFNGTVNPDDGISKRIEKDDMEKLREENEQLKRDNETNAMAIMELTELMFG